MTPFKKSVNTINWQSRVRRGGLYIAVSVALAAQVGCGDSDNGSDWEEVTTLEPTKGVITTLEESTAGEFEIVDEQIIANAADSRVIIRKLGGTQDTLTLAQAQGLVQPQDTVLSNSNQNNHNGYHRHSLGTSLWWGSMGYLMGRSFSTPVQSSYYRNGNVSFQGGSRSAEGISQELRTTARTQTTMRPTSGRSGFFKGRAGTFGG